MKRWYSPFKEEQELLAHYASKSPTDLFIEIGAYEGNTTVFLAQRFPNRRIVVIDPWDGSQDASGFEVYETFVRNIAHYPNVEFIRKRSQYVRLSGAGLIFHDGDHRNPDFQHWFDQLEPRGSMIVHDLFDPGWPAVRVAFDKLQGGTKTEIQVYPKDREGYSTGPRGLGVIFKNE